MAKANESFIEKMTTILDRMEKLVEEGIKR